MTNPDADRIALKEGYRARAEGKPCKSPYEGIVLLRKCHEAWLRGWKTNDLNMKEKEDCQEKP